MSTTQSQLFPPPVRGSNLSKQEQLYLATLQYQLPRVDVDTTAGPETIALPPAGLNSSTGQSNQNQELIYCKTSSDGNTVTITGAASGTVTLTMQWQTARFKSNGTNWVKV